MNTDITLTTALHMLSNAYLFSALLLLGFSYVGLALIDLSDSLSQWSND